MIIRRVIIRRTDANTRWGIAGCQPIGVPRFVPFPALRYRLDPLEDVSAPPYDVLSEEDRRRLAERHRHNIVHVDVPVGGEDRYRRAGELLSRWIESQVLVADSTPTFTICRMKFLDPAGRPRITSGVIGALEVVDEGAGGVLPHERTTPKAKSDRLDLTRATATNLSPVWGLSVTGGLTDLLAEPGEPVGSVESDGVLHLFERVTESARISSISSAIASGDVVIADGHHRYAISRTYRDEQRTLHDGATGDADFTMTFVQELEESQLSVAAIHRLYDDVDLATLETTLAASFEFGETVPITSQITRTMDDRGSLVLVRPDRSGTFLKPIPDVFARQRDLDGARLEQALADLPHSVTYQHGVTNVVDLVAAGSARAGILIRPVTVAEIRRTAREGLLMPPKSTFFSPKLLTGPVLRPMASGRRIR